MRTRESIIVNEQVHQSSTHFHNHGQCIGMVLLGFFRIECIIDYIMCSHAETSHTNVKDIDRKHVMRHYS